MDQLESRIPRRSNPEGVKDLGYLEALQSLGKEHEKTESTVHHEEGVLYRKLTLWVPCRLGDSVLANLPRLSGCWLHRTGYQ
jgi:hypothetical protein